MAYGWWFAKRGHASSSGQIGILGHSCLKPTPFKVKRGHKAPRERHHSLAPQRPDFINEDEDGLEAQLLAAIED